MNLWNLLSCMNYFWACGTYFSFIQWHNGVVFTYHCAILLSFLNLWNLLRCMNYFWECGTYFSFIQWHNRVVFTYHCVILLPFWIYATYEMNCVILWNLLGCMNYFWEDAIYHCGTLWNLLECMKYLRGWHCNFLWNLLCNFVELTWNVLFCCLCEFTELMHVLCNFVELTRMYELFLREDDSDMMEFVELCGTYPDVWTCGTYLNVWSIWEDDSITSYGTYCVTLWNLLGMCVILLPLWIYGT